VGARSPPTRWTQAAQKQDADAACQRVLNVALYRRPAGRRRFQNLWAMTERSGAARSPRALQIGKSRLTWVPSHPQVQSRFGWQLHPCHQGPGSRAERHGCHHPAHSRGLPAAG